MNQTEESQRTKTKYYAINEASIKNNLVSLTGVAENATNYFLWKETESTTYGLTIKRMHSPDGKNNKKPASLVWKATWIYDPTLLMFKPAKHCVGFAKEIVGEQAKQINEIFTNNYLK